MRVNLGIRVATLSLAMGLLFVPDAFARAISQPAVHIPVAYDVDVVVVGGSAAGVAAAVEAAERGASVFVAAPRPYLGEDMCATYRLWLEPDEEPETPFEKTLYKEPEYQKTQVGASLPFTYKTSLPSADPHPDKPSAPMLSNGRWNSAFSESVQYNGDVTVTAELRETARLGKIHVMTFQRPGDIETRDAVFFTSGDGESWEEAGSAANKLLGQGDYLNSALILTCDVKREAKYVKVVARKTSHVERLLLGEIVIEAYRPEKVKAPRKEERIPPTLMQVKRTLDQALLDAGVPFLYGCLPTDLLRDTSGKPAGIVMVSRSGRQAVRARIIIDATPRATVARMAAAAFRPYPAGEHVFQRIVVGGTPPKDGPFEARPLPSPVHTGMAEPNRYDAIAYTLRLPMADGTFASFAEADALARDLTWSPGQVGASEVLFEIPPDPMHAKRALNGPWPGANLVALDAFRPAAVPGLYVLGGCADVPRAAAERMLRPLELIRCGQRVGEAAANDVAAAGPPALPELLATGQKPDVPGEVRELSPVRPPALGGSATVADGSSALPVLAEYDVVVVGGGTGGAPAGIGAARRGAETLVLEYLHGLGGVGTLGLIGKYYYGHRTGFTAELDAGVDAMDGFPANNGAWDVEIKMEWYRKELRKAGADVWFGVLGCGALVDGNRLTGVVVTTPLGRGAILAETVIDSTGNSDVAAAAGAACMTVGSEHIAMQGTGLPPRRPGASYTNTDYTLTDDGDVLDIWRTFVAGRMKYEGAYDLGQIIDTRERRRIIGDFIVSPLDLFNGRTYPDSVVVSESNFDTHGYTVHDLFSLKTPDKACVMGYTPYRSLLPKGFEGILVTGLGISAHRDAMPILRMQPDIQNQGYAAGVASAMACEKDVPVRAIDVKTLQIHLVEKGNLPESVLTDKDAFPLPEEDVRQAVQSVVNEYQGLGVILAQVEQALPMLRTAFGVAEYETERQIYAHILGMLGDPAAAKNLAERVAAQHWDEGWNFKGMGQFGGSLSPLDSLVIALGRTKTPRALETILPKVAELGPKDAFSHHRAVAVALETIASPEAAKPLAELLRKPGMMGQAVHDVDGAAKHTQHANPNLSRELSLRELILARALYRCGDHEGLGESILREYANDLRNRHARHAAAVLEFN